MPKLSFLGVPEGYLTIREFSNEIGMTPATVHKYIKKGIISTKLCVYGEIKDDDDSKGVKVIHKDELQKFEKTEQDKS